MSRPVATSRGPREASRRRRLTRRPAAPRGQPPIPVVARAAVEGQRPMSQEYSTSSRTRPHSQPHVANITQTRVRVFLQTPPHNRPNGRRHIIWKPRDVQVGLHHRGQRKRHVLTLDRNFRFGRSDQNPYTRDFHFASRIRAFIHQHASPHARFLQRTLFRSQLPSGGAALDGKPTGAPAFRVFLRHRSTRVPCLRRFVALRPRVSLPALAAPRSSAACRRTVAGSDALPPAGASSTAHASPAGPRFSLAAAGDSSATSA